jgi:hypothetical protein
MESYRHKLIPFKLPDGPSSIIRGILPNRNIDRTTPFAYVVSFRASMAYERSNSSEQYGKSYFSLLKFLRNVLCLLTHSPLQYGFRWLSISMKFRMMCIILSYCEVKILPLSARISYGIPWYISSHDSSSACHICSVDSPLRNISDEKLVL